MNQTTSSIISIAITLLSITTITFAAAPFELSLSHPAHPEFKNNLLGFYGVNSSIEPQITKNDKPVYEKILPHLESNPNQAIAILEEASNDESNAAFDYLLGILYYQQDNLEKANLWLDKALKKFPNFRRAIRLKAISLIRQDSFDKSIAAFLRVIKLGGGDEQSFGLLAYAYLNQEKYASALEAYQNARMFEPDNHDFKMGLAHCYLQLNDNKKAIGLFEELIAESPTDKSLWLAQTSAYFADENYSEATSNLEIIKGLGHADFKILTRLSQIYFNQSLEKLSASNLIAALPLIQNSEQNKAVLDILDLYLSQHWFDASKQIIEGLPKSTQEQLSKSERISWDLAQAALDLGINQNEKAHKALKTILSQDPLNGAALILMGNYYQKENLIEEAIFQYERASNLEETKFKAYLALGQLQVEKGEFGEALKVLYQAQQIKPGKNLLDYIQQVEKAYRSSL